MILWGWSLLKRKPAGQKAAGSNSTPKRKRSRRIPKAKIDRIFDGCMEQGPYVQINGTNVRQFAESRFAFWCDRYADASLQDPPDPIRKKLEEQDMALGIAHEQRVLEQEQPELVEIQLDDDNLRVHNIRDHNLDLTGMGYKESFRSGLIYMTCGASSMRQPTLFYLPLGFVGKPDLLERRKGKSAFGSHYYAVTEIKSARTITSGHKMQAAFYTLMLGHIQGRFAKEYDIIDGIGRRDTFQFNLNDVTTMIEYLRALSRDMMPTPIYGNGRTPWVEYENRMAMQSNNISLIRRIGDKRSRILMNAGINTVDDIIKAGQENITKIIGNKLGVKAFENATAISQKRAVRRNSRRYDFKAHDMDMFLDLEWNPWAPVGAYPEEIYLVGLLIREKEKPDQYISFLPHGGYGSTANLLGILSETDCPIYHWTSVDKTQTLSLLKECFGDISASLKQRFVDLYPIADRLYALPIPNMKVKHVSGWLGHNPTNGDVNAMNAYDLYCNWWDHNDEESLNLVLNYNKDDCLAVKVIKDWLVENQDKPDN